MAPFPARRLARARRFNSARQGIDPASAIRTIGPAGHIGVRARSSAQRNIGFRGSILRGVVFTGSQRIHVPGRRPTGLAAGPGTLQRRARTSHASTSRLVGMAPRRANTLGSQFFLIRAPSGSQPAAESKPFGQVVRVEVVAAMSGSTRNSDDRAPTWDNGNILSANDGGRSETIRCSCGRIALGAQGSPTRPRAGSIAAFRRGQDRRSARSLVTSGRSLVPRRQIGPHPRTRCRCTRRGHFRVLGHEGARRLAH